jgi:cytochrome b subunit of formate dehydrogenase
MLRLREFIAIILFLAGVFLAIRLCLEPFSGMTLVIALVCFVFAYVIWPSKKKGQREEDNWFLDIMEIMIELPLDLFLWTFRAAGHLVRKGDGPGSDL